MDMTTLDRSIGRAVGASAGAAWKQPVTFLVVAGLAFGVGTVGILSLQPVYQGTALLLTGQASLDPAGGGAGGRPDTAATLTQVALSDDVIRAAVAAVGGGTLSARGAGRPSLIDQARARLFGADAAPAPRASPMTEAVTAFRDRLQVRSEVNSNILQISFRDQDPALAASFANAVAQAFSDRQRALAARPGAAEFFLMQKARFEEEHRLAAAALDRFAIEHRIYAVDEQRALLLRRLSELDARMATGRSELAEKQGQRQTLAETLRKLAPVARSPYVSSLVDALGGERPAGSGRAGGFRDDPSSDPPLLLVQVYQSSMATLFRLGADIQGIHNLLAQMEQEQARVAAEVEGLSRRAEEAERLRQAVRQAAYNVDLYGKRAVEEQIAAQLQASRLASVKVIQHAGEAQGPAFPNYRLMLPAAALASAALGLGCALLMNGRRR